MNRRWEAAHPERVEAWRKRYKAANQEAVRHSTRLNKYRRKDAIGRHSEKEWEDLKSIFSFRCPMCWKKEPSIRLTEDHKIPIARGGTNHIDNIQPLCKSCNSRKYVKVWFASCPLAIKHLLETKW